jgi:hypothetical protein
VGGTDAVPKLPANRCGDAVPLVGRLLCKLPGMLACASGGKIPTGALGAGTLELMMYDGPVGRMEPLSLSPLHKLVCKLVCSALMLLRLGAPPRSERALK